MGKVFFDTVDDCNQKIKDSVIMFKDEPCIVNNIYGMNKSPVADVNILPFGKGDNKKDIPFTDDYFNIRQLPSLGYVDYGDNSYYLTRVPARQWKQGLCRQNVIIPTYPDFRTPSWGTLLESNKLVNMLLGKYDPFAKVYEQVTEANDPVGKAISKVFALSIDDLESLTLWYKGTKIGNCNNFKKTGPVFKLPQKFSYLKECLEESKIKLEAA